MKISDWIEVFQIFAKHSPDGVDAFLDTSAEHDEFYFGIDNTVIDPYSEDGARLEELGVHYDDDIDSWYIFT